MGFVNQFFHEFLFKFKVCRNIQTLFYPKMQNVNRTVTEFAIWQSAERYVYVDPLLHICTSYNRYRQVRYSISNERNCVDSNYCNIRYIRRDCEFPVEFETKETIATSTLTTRPGWMTYLPCIIKGTGTRDYKWLKWINLDQQGSRMTNKKFVLLYIFY